MHKHEICFRESMCVEDFETENVSTYGELNRLTFELIPKAWPIRLPWPYSFDQIKWDWDVDM